ncbi:MAG: hypothetical protein GXO79_15240 [Chlorobi bacterium]|nr:hypothetical protein [Chlorobiota bacterium]
MIKKVSYIILSVLLLISTVGLTINLHYCAGVLYSYGIDVKAENCCKNEIPKEQTINMNRQIMCHTIGNDNNKCDDESVIVKINDSFTNAIQKTEISNNLLTFFIKTLIQHKINYLAVNKEAPNFDNSHNYSPDTGLILSLFQSYLL